MPPADFDVYLRNIMNRLATRQAPMSAVCGAEAAAPVEPSADEEQVIYILSNYETQFTSFIMYYAREPFKRMATLHTHLILSCTQARSNLEDDIEPESTWEEAGLHEQTQLTDDNGALVVHGPRTVHYTSKFVSSQLTSKGKEVVFPVHDEKDRVWARRLEWAIDAHLDRAEAETDQLQTDFEQILRESKEVGFRKYDQQRIADLVQQLENAHRRLRDRGVW